MCYGPWCCLPRPASMLPLPSWVCTDHCTPMPTSMPMTPLRATAATHAFAASSDRHNPGIPVSVPEAPPICPALHIRTDLFRPCRSLRALALTTRLTSARYAFRSPGTPHHSRHNTATAASLPTPDVLHVHPCTMSLGMEGGGERHPQWRGSGGNGHPFWIGYQRPHPMGPNPICTPCPNDTRQPDRG